MIQTTPKLRSDKVKNISERSTKISELTDSDLKLLTEKNKEDLLLYNETIEKFNLQLKEYAINWVSKLKFQIKNKLVDQRI